MRFRVLGSIDAERDGASVPVGGPQQRRLLGVLVLGRGYTVSADRLVDALWPDGDAPEGAARSVMTYVSRLRGALANGHVVTSGPGYQLTCDRASCDVDEFEALVAEAAAALPDRALACYDRALALWRGPDAFGEFAAEWWALAESTRLAELRVVAREEHAAALMAIGHHGRAVPGLESLIVEHPLRERPVSLLMHALVATGRQAEALRVFRSYRTRLAEQTGLDPSAELTQLERTISGSLEPTGEASLGRPLRGYTIHEAIGEGSYGRVYLATQPGTERRVAIKVIRPDLADSSEFVRRFEAEARLVARLEHPHIVPLYDYWREPGGAYLVFRYLAGGTARDAVISGGAWSVPRVSQLVEEVGGALIAAHAAGVLHNDVTSSNVLLDDRGSAYLTDFGIAVGTDDSSAAADPRGDVRGLGWVLWELLAGVAPGEGRTPASVATRRAREPVPRLMEHMAVVPEGLDAVLARATDAEHGYVTVAELVLGWRAAVGRPEGVLSPVGTDERRAVDLARREAARQLAESAAAGINPYKGLRPFDEADASAFFGRDAVTDDLEDAVRQHRLVTVVGASGSGKSSLVRAGLVPRLRTAGHTVVTMTPGDDPVGALRQALSEVSVRRTRAGDLTTQIRTVATASGPLLVVIDQFEECWTRTAADPRDDFLDVVARCIEDGPDVRFVTTIRADVFDKPLQVTRLGAQIGAGAFVLPPLTPAQIGDAITLPAARAGVTVDEAVVAELITDAASQPGSLPLLQFTLAELYDRRVDGRIGPDALTGVGGMAGSIGRRAEELYAGLEPPAQDDTRELFSRLVMPGEGVPDTRRRARLSELTDRAQAVADQYVAARLLVTDRDQITREPTVEVAHEALLSRWPRLAGWIDADRRWLTQLQHLAAAARAWDERGRAAADLYRGARLESAIEALGEGRVVSDLECEFVDAGRDARDSELLAARKSARHLRRLLVAVGAALVVALVGGFIALDQRRDAQRERRDAQHERRVATARELAAAADANLAEDPERSILLALAAVDTTRSSDGAALPEAQDALHRAVTTSRIVLNVPGLGGTLDWSPDGDIFVTEGREETGLVDIRDADTGESVLAFHGHDIDVNDVDFSADGSMLATAGDDGAVRVWDPRTGEELWKVQGDGAVGRPSFSADGARLLAVWPGEVWVTEARTGDVVDKFELPNLGGADLSPDGQRAVLDGRVFDVRSGEEDFVLEGEFGWADPYVWSPDGKWIAAAIDSTPQVLIWDAATGKRRATVHAEVTAAAWSPDSTRIATTGHDGTTRVWAVDVGAARELFSFSTQDLSTGVGLAFSPDGNRLMVGDEAITAVKVYDLSIRGGREWANVPDGIPGVPGAASFTRDGRQLVTSSVDGAAALWDAESGDPTRLLGAGRVPSYVVTSPDGRLLAGSTFDTLPVSLWDVDTGELVASALSDLADGFWGLAWSPDGTHLAIIHGPWAKREVSVVDRTGALVASIRAPESGAMFTSVSFSADGRLLATAQLGERRDPALEHVSIWDWARAEVVRTIDTQADQVAFDPTGERLVSDRLLEGTLDVWDTQTGDRLTTLAGHKGLINDVTFSRDGSKVATASADGTARVWDPATGSQLQVLHDNTELTTVVFSPDGSRLASVSVDAIARVWTLNLDELIAIANARLTRGFSDDECRQFLHVDRCPDG